ncbi:hypothetical protein RHMOL_Rhmol02G0236900 [Rhododendron molle]|uniref:Uncharacterized protein n=2 Tax=Rhododendron molle TaxID=49168 RepID=A0ACC0PUS3_RHOML|nr:hypothetical protein RHMOL_Rhmol02G0236900 [Rhododendron molle]KAI8568906.1 hypothetical protein RHMOL_Rhmol02G0236900 [Rhododendron molle]
MATPILSLTSSSSGRERNWSTFGGIHTKKRNRLDATRLNNLVYLQFNAKLINNKRRGKDVLRASEATNAQGWIVEGGDVDEEDLVLGLTWEMIEEATGADEVLQSRRTTRNVGVRGNSLIQPTPKWTESSFYRKMGCLFEKLEKVALAVQVEQKNCDAVKKRYAAAIVEQRSCYSLLKDLQEECAKNERLQSQSSTIPS